MEGPNMSRFHRFWLALPAVIAVAGTNAVAQTTTTTQTTISTIAIVRTATNQYEVDRVTASCN